MWCLVLVSLLCQNVVLGTNFTELFEEGSDSMTKNLNEMKTTEFESLLDDWSTAAAEYVQEKSGSVLERGQPIEEDRRLKYKRAEMKFLMKTLLIFKLILGLFLPVSVIASKIISWKAVTLSLMAFMLAKILFLKNLLTGKGVFSVTPANYVPPFYVHGGVNEAFWKRQGETQCSRTPVKRLRDQTLNNLKNKDVQVRGLKPLKHGVPFRTS